jgi:hypothetical protein
VERFGPCLVWSTLNMGHSGVFGGRNMCLTPDTYGHLVVTLGQGGRQQTHKVHRLVLVAFAGLPRPEQEALHGPGGRQDNRWPENLRWGTHVANMEDKYRDGSALVGGIHPRGAAKLTEDLAREVFVRYFAEDISQAALALEYDVAQATVWRIMSGKSWSHVTAMAVT